MFRIHGPQNHGGDAFSRRECLQVGSVGAMGLSLPALLQARAVPEANTGWEGALGRAKACIVLFLLGGPPQHETWDPKPEAPAEIRGEFKPIASATPDFFVSELMPRVAHWTPAICALRAMASDDNAHSSSGYWMLTGQPHAPMNFENAKPGAPNDWPCLGALTRRLRGDRGGMPGAVTLPEEIWNNGRVVWPGQTGGWLGRSADPWMLTCDPATPDFQVPGLDLPAEIPPLRMSQRQSLLRQVNGHLDRVEALASGQLPNHTLSTATNIAANSSLRRFDSLGEQALRLIASPQGRKAFDLHAEPAAVRDRYGRSRFGQSVLLARRLVEAGVSLVQVNWTRAKEDPVDSPVWDTHAHNAQRLKQHLMPTMDLAYSALLEDLSARGLLDETLVVWMGEFGRTPRINARGGRDHWGHVYSVALAGGGVRGGQVLGASDSRGAFPKDGRLAPWDLAATIFHCLGYAPSTEVHDVMNRPIALSRGNVIRAAF